MQKWQKRVLGLHIEVKQLKNKWNTQSKASTMRFTYASQDWRTQTGPSLRRAEPTYAEPQE